MEKEELKESFTAAKNLISDVWLDQAQLGFVQTTFAWDQIFTFGVNIVLVTKDNEGFLNLVTYQIFKLKDDTIVNNSTKEYLRGKIREAISQQIHDLKSYLLKAGKQ